MKQTMALPKLGVALAGLFFLFQPAAAPAQSTWQWQMSLRVETRGDALYMPSAVGFDTATERYYAVDTGRSRLVSFDRNGALLRAFTADDRLKSPFDMVRLENGQLWVVEKGRNSVTRIDIGAREVKPVVLKDGERQVFPDRISYAGGRLHVLDRASGQVLRLNGEMKVEQRFGCSDCPGGISDFVLEGGDVWGLEARSKKVFHFRPDGTVAEAIDLGDHVDFPVSLALEPSGSVYVLDRHRPGIAVYSRDGRFRHRFLGAGQGQGQLHFPRQVRFDPWGKLCVVDEGNGRVEIYSR